jgi:4-hydroxyphenylpyruvate dioxygenase
MVYRLSISSHSLGRAWIHDLETKLDQAASYGYEGIEMFFEDLEYLAGSLPGGVTDGNRLEAARLARRMCDERNLEIIGLQPFMHYEGLLDREEHAKRIEELRLWFQLVKILRTQLIQIPANFLPSSEITGDRKVIVQDLRRVADLGLRETPVVRFAYENLCWGTYIDTWEQAWDVVAAVDKPNFGMCLDTFNIAGREWADPTSPDGKIADAEAVLERSLDRLRRTVDVGKVFYVEVADAERMRDPMTPDHVFWSRDQPPRMSWSRNARLFAFEKSGYLPIVRVLKAIADRDGLGYEGWISAEIFSRTLADPSPNCPRDHARRGKESWDKLVRVMGWGDRISSRQVLSKPTYAASL